MIGTRQAAVIALLALLPLTGCASRVAAGPPAVRAEAISLNSEDPNQRRLGRLHYLAGVELDSDDPRFGGLSGLSLAADGRRLVAITDLGNWLRAELQFDGDGRLTGLAGVALGRLKGENGAPLPEKGGKRERDAEAVERLARGGYLVSFERRHRVLRYPGVDLAGRPVPFAIPPDIDGAPRNGGVEAMTPLPDGRILLLSEDFRDAGGNLIGWLYSADGNFLGRLSLTATGIFRPTDLAALPNGDVLLLERRYTVAGGAGARLSRLAADQIRPGGRLDGEELAVLAPPLAVDNFEGLAVVPAPRGGWLIYLLSDDNFNPLQRTLLLQFHLNQ
ncbi:MAG: esterase-like activity of phytase family protein [Alphaproteobacteria bacterium]|jgi:hypothetical protein|nr:esterase-like activity of phytase family protein [Alphaproteobacteria bacterium]MDP6567087.1 esterase-like activity of phytase family protein [Alphaproteobacteria bacterium]MDP6811566.1 esterase-like activity of phytase family protein [Alphaproteobacteria bacterium]